MSVRFLIALLLVQATCTGVFLFRILSSLLGLPYKINWQLMELIELGAALGLVLGLVLGVRAYFIARQRCRAMQQTVNAARGAMADVIFEHFDRWTLTPAERDVALFSLKGMSTQEMADLRGTSVGTVKAQTSAIYRKAGVKNRSQLVSLFLEDLLSDGLLSPEEKLP